MNVARVLFIVSTVVSPACCLLGVRNCIDQAVSELLRCYHFDVVVVAVFVAVVGWWDCVVVVHAACVVHAVIGCGLLVSCVASFRLFAC